MTTTPRKVTARKTAPAARKATAHRGTTRKATTARSADTGERLIEVQLPYLKSTAATHVYGYAPRTKQFKDSEDLPMVYIRKQAFENGRRKTPYKSITVQIAGAAAK